MQQQSTAGQHTYISGRCSRATYEKYAGMGETTEDDALAMRGIWRMGVELKPEKGKPLPPRWIMVMSVFGEDILAELPALFPGIPGPWKRFDDATKDD